MRLPFDANLSENYFQVLQNKIRISIKNTASEFNMIVPFFLPVSKRFDQQSPRYKSKENIKVQIYCAEIVDLKF